MNRRLRLVLAGAVLLVVYGAAAAPSRAAPRIARPNPTFVGVRVDYVGPIPAPGGGAATLAPLSHAIIAQAVADQQYLAFSSKNDLGGFMPAPTGQFAASSGGHNLVGQAVGGSQIPQLAQAANGSVNSFAAAGAPVSTPPETGQQPVPGLGTPPPVTPPSNNNSVPPPNQGFGGTPPPSPRPTTTSPTTTTPAPPPPTTVTTPTVTTPTVTAPTVPTTTTQPEEPAPPPPPPTTPSPPGPVPAAGASCGTAGLTVTSDHSTCRIQASNMAPGGSASEIMTIRNDTDAPFTLSLRADGAQNRLWQDLRLGVWEVGTAAPAPLPPLLFWTSQANSLDTLQPGQTIRYQIELLLPATSGNATQGMSALIDFVWSAQG